MRLLLFFGLVFAIWRATRLMVVDEFPPVKAMREWFVYTFGEVNPQGHLVGGKHLGRLGYALAYLWTCPWCMSIWVGAGVIWLADWRLSVPYPWLIVALGSLVSGWAQAIEGLMEQRSKLLDQQIEAGYREPRR